MADKLDLTGDIASAIDGALLRGSPVVLAYVTPDGHPSVSFRGSTQVHSADQLAVWARNPETGLAAAVAGNPYVSLAYFGGADGPGPKFLSIKGRARVDPSANDTVYAAMVAAERDLDREKGGVAVIIDVDSVFGFGSGGQFQQAR